VLELARRIDADRFDVRVAALRGGPVADALRQAGIEVEVLNVRGKWDAVKLGRLAALLRRWRIDLLHTHLFHADLVGRPAAHLAGVRHLVHTVHVAEARFRPWHFAFARLAAGLCDRIVCVSAAVMEHHRRRSGLPRSRYTVIPNGIDVDAFARDPAARRRLRRQWAVAEDQVVAAFVGRLDRQKGPDVLIRAMDSLQGRMTSPNVHLLIAGDGPMRGQVAKMIERSRLGGSVRLLGFTDDVSGLLSAADILVMPSRWEGFGLAAAEAMAAGLPVIATRVAGLEELVAHERTGLLVRSEDCDELAGAIARLAADPDLRRAMGQAGRDRVAAHYAIQANVAAHERLYAGVL